MGTRRGARGLAPPSAAVPVPVRTEGGQAPGGKGPVPKQYAEGLSGEPARHTKLCLNRRVRSDRGGEVFCHRLRMQACRSRDSAIAAEVFMNNVG